MMSLRTLATLLAVLVASPVLAGCLGSGAEDDLTSTAGQDDPISDVVVEAEEGVFVAENRGILRGQVRDDTSTPVDGARLSLVGTEFFSSTKTDGRFLIRNVTLGDHHYRVEALGFQAAEGTVVITAGNITDLNVTLIPTQQQRGAGYKPHLHDFWGERTEIVLMDESVNLNEPHRNQNQFLTEYTMGASSRAYWSNVNTTAAYYFLPLPEETADGTPPIVLPGTAEVHVRFSWDPQEITADELGLIHTTAWDSEERFLEKKGNGETWVIRLENQSHADSGHQTFSFWEFWMYVGNDVRQAPNWEPILVNGELNVQIKLVKGEIEFEPPHTDYWQDADMLQLLSKNKPYNPDVNFCNGCGTQGFRLDSGVIVPPGTTKMRIEFEWDHDTSLPNNADFEFNLIWRTGDQNRHQTRLSEYHTAEATACGDRCKVYEFAVEPHQTDAFYQSRTAWNWVPKVDGFEDENVWFDRGLGRHFYANIFVWKNPDFDAASA